MLDSALLICGSCIVVSMLLVLMRLLRGPTLSDRILALDTLYVNAIALIVVFGIAQSDQVHFEAALLIAMFGFVGTVALAKFALRGDIIE